MKIDKKKIAVIDGDTFRVDSQTARLAGVDAPMIGEDLADEATAYFRNLIVDKKIKLSIVGLNNKEVVVEMWAGDKYVNDEMNMFLKEKGKGFLKRHASMSLRKSR